MLALQAMLGLEYPQVAAGLGAAWTVARVFYTLGGRDTREPACVGLLATTAAAGQQRSAAWRPGAPAERCGVFARALRLPATLPPPPRPPAGYSTGDPQGRLPGGLASGLAFLALLLATLGVGLRTALGA